VLLLVSSGILLAQGKGKAKGKATAPGQQVSEQATTTEHGQAEGPARRGTRQALWAGSGAFCGTNAEQSKLICEIEIIAACAECGQEIPRLGKRGFIQPTRPPNFSAIRPPKTL